MTEFSTSSSLSRRDALRHLVGSAAVLATGCAGPSTGPQSAEITTPEIEYPTVIQNGRVFSGGSFRALSVGITETGTLRLSEVPLRGRRMIDATGKIVVPGFIDILADDAANPDQSYRTFEYFKLTDGLTTVLQLHGGAEDPMAFHQQFDRVPHAVNYGVGIFVMRVRNALNAERSRFAHVERCLDQGALAVCHSLEYQPTPYVELREYARLAKKYERPLFLHLRYSSTERELDGVREALQLARETGVRLHLNHLHSTGGTYHMPQALDLIQNARAKGADVTCCVYPYSYWATYVHSRRFDPGWQQRYGLTYADLQLVGTRHRLSERSFGAYRRKYGYLVAVPEGTMPFEKTVDLALQADFCLIGSDGGIVSKIDANSHPRGAGCFATALRHALSRGFPLEKLLPKISSLPARLLRPALKNRGELKDGYAADLTIFNPKTVNGRASVENPNQTSVGIEAVFVNGKLAYEGGKVLTDAGQPIRLR